MSDTPPPSDGAAAAAKKLGFLDTTKAAWASKGGWGKAGTVAGTGVGVIVIGKGLKDLGRVVGVISPKVDDEGKEVPVGGGTLVKSLAELGVGVGAIYFSLTKGGKGPAIAPAV